jgi:uncharacterized repeat protein (TIGR02543 family)
LSRSGFTISNVLINGSTSSNGGSVSGTTITFNDWDGGVTGPITITATQTENNVSVTVNAGTGGSTNPSGTAGRVPGTAFSIAATPHDGYRFANWSGSGGSFGNVNSASTTFNPSSATTITANFAAKTLTVNYNANSPNGHSSGTTASHSRTAGAGAVSIRENGFTVMGYRFLGWNTAANGSGTSRPPGINITDAIIENHLPGQSADGSITLFAQWERNTHIARLILVGGTDPDWESTARHHMVLQPS